RRARSTVSPATVPCSSIATAVSAAVSRYRPCARRVSAGSIISIAGFSRGGPQAGRRRAGMGDLQGGATFRKEYLLLPQLPGSMGDSPRNPRSRECAEGQDVAFLQKWTP